MQASTAAPHVAFRTVRNGSEKPVFEWLFPETGAHSDRLRLNVLFTTPEETQLALRRAAELSAGLGAEILLIVPQVVPFPLELDNPPVPPEFTSDQLRSLVETIDADLDGHIYLCRDRLQTFLHVLKASSITVLGVKKRWFFSKSERIAKALRRRGHQVITVKSA